MLADMLSLAQLKWKTGYLKVPFLFSFGPSWFNLEDTLSQAHGWFVLTRCKYAIFSSNRDIYDCVQLAIETEVKPRSKICRAQSSHRVRASPSLADLVLE